MPIFKSDNFPIAFEKIDPCGPRNLLFIHGNLASKEWWYPAIEILKQQDGTGVTLAADWRGYGGSRGLKTVQEIDFTTFARDMTALIDDQGLDQVHVVGHSTGGLIGMLAVLERPELFSSLILLDSVGAKGLELSLPKEQVLAHFDRMSVDSDYCRNVLAATIKGCDPSAESFNRLLQITRNCDPVMWRGVIEVLASQIDIRNRLAEINLPTLILHGEEDLVLPVQVSESLCQGLPQAQLKVIPGQGHSLNLENPNLFISECGQFWKNLA